MKKKVASKIEFVVVVVYFLPKNQIKLNLFLCLFCVITVIVNVNLNMEKDAKQTILFVVFIFFLFFVLKKQQKIKSDRTCEQLGK